MGRPRFPGARKWLALSGPLALKEFDIFGILYAKQTQFRSSRPRHWRAGVAESRRGMGDRQTWRTRQRVSARHCQTPPVHALWKPWTRTSSGVNRGLGSRPVLPGKSSTRLRDVLRRSSRATSSCDGTTARRWLCLRTGSGITEARPHPRALPPPRTTWAKWTSRVYFVPQSKWPLPRSLRAPEPVDPRERGGNDSAVSEQSQLCECLSLSY